VPRSAIRTCPELLLRGTMIIGARTCIWIA
jgi:hypothetical protein